MSINAHAGYFKEEASLFRIFDSSDEHVTEAQLLLEELGYEFIRGQLMSINKMDIEDAFENAEKKETKNIFKKILRIMEKNDEEYIDMVIY